MQEASTRSPGSTIIEAEKSHNRLPAGCRLGSWEYGWVQSKGCGAKELDGIKARSKVLGHQEDTDTSLRAQRPGNLGSWLQGTGSAEFSPALEGGKGIYIHFFLCLFVSLNSQLTKCVLSVCVYLSVSLSFSQPGNDNFLFCFLFFVFLRQGFSV